MRKTVGYAVAALMLVGGMGSAMAADLPMKAPPMVVAVYNWTGFYVGVNGGGGEGRSTGNLVANSGGIAIPGALAAGTIPFALNVQPEGWVGGGQAGYNWQRDHLVFGVEADLDGSGIRQSVRLTDLTPPGGFLPTINTASSRLDWFGTVRGRLGYAWNNFMVYGTGGFAYGGTTDSGTSQTTTPPPLGSGSVGATRTGWAAGAGFEWGFKGNWSLKGEYLHVDLGSSNVTESFLPGSPDFLTYRFRHEYDMGRIGINYRFAPGPVVAKY